MVKKEAKESAAINYEEAYETEPSSLWRHSDLKRHFANLVLKKYGFTPSWTIQEQSLLSRMMKEFSPKDISEMMTYHVVTIGDKRTGMLFKALYNKRIELYNAMKDIDKEYKWS